MLKLLLDEHVSPDIADGLRRSRIPVAALSEWQEGSFLGVADDLILEKAASVGVTLVTYDRKTIPPLLKSWAEAGHDHGGVILVDDKTIPPSDIGGLIRALEKLHETEGNEDWTNQVRFLRR